MKKIYQSRTAISVNVVLRSGKSAHIAFTAQSNGSSVYATDNPDIQRALERHYRYRTLFRLAGMEAEAAPAEGDGGGKAAAREEKGETRAITVSDLAAAKDFLADTFGISRTSLRTRKSIIEAAKARGIAFDGLE